MKITTDDVLGNHTRRALPSHTLQENGDASTGPFKHNERGGTDSTTDHEEAASHLRCH
jgi:hypothetical protein